jgi:hypothetical protein
MVQNTNTMSTQLRKTVVYSSILRQELLRKCFLTMYNPEGSGEEMEESGGVGRRVEESGGEGRRVGWGGEWGGEESG